MSGPKHWPLIAWSKQQLMDDLWNYERRIKHLREELDRRGERDDKRHGFAVPIHSPGMIETAYQHFPTAVEAYAGARERWPNDEAAPYRVHPIYLGKDDQP